MEMRTEMAVALAAAIEQSGAGYTPEQVGERAVAILRAIEGGLAVEAESSPPTSLDEMAETLRRGPNF